MSRTCDPGSDTCRYDTCLNALWRCAHGRALPAYGAPTRGAEVAPSAGTARRWPCRSPQSNTSDGNTSAFYDHRLAAGQAERKRVVQTDGGGNNASKPTHSTRFHSSNRSPNYQASVIAVCTCGCCCAPLCTADVGGSGNNASMSTHSTRIRWTNRRSDQQVNMIAVRRREC